ncbi:TetR/AcrR family transcriptional regulator [Microbacterium sp. YJN-G]|uniref:TetR/AcrR family transcriptional regulator n=1 Tax=Microbacterium sp. YJN-G TaxID=2763257 RepID=UPI0018784FFD|nr:TetR/AcrR family transcriptional regulator [Microbacterium sp. YJN-G]
MPALTPAADRLLQTASRLFCREGIRPVGIDRILAEAEVAKATLYQAFGSKEALVIAHLEQRDAADRQAYRAAISSVPAGPDRLLASFELAARRSSADGFIGCVFLNALVEFPDPGEPIARAVREHRDWVRGQWLDALAGRDDAERIADEAQLAYDGGLLGSKVAHSAEPILLAADMMRARLGVTAAV